MAKTAAKKTAPKKAARTASIPKNKDLKSELKTLRDDARVRLHLAGNEVRDAWDKLSHQAEQVAVKLERTLKDLEKNPATEQARVKLHLAAMELREQWEAVQPQLQSFSTALAKKGEEAMETLRNLPTEQQKLQAKLAEMSAEAAISERLERAKQEIAKAKSASQRAIKEAGKTFKDTLKAFKKALA